MRITFIGTSHGVPAADRYCSCIMLEVNGAIYFIDGGAPMIDGLLRHGKDVNAVRAVFTTHSHGDHTNGITHMADLMNWYYKESAADFYFTEKPLLEAVENLILACDSRIPIVKKRIRFKVTDPISGYEDENIKVSYIPTKHMPDGHPSYSVLVRAEGKSVLFSGDFSQSLAKRDVPTIISEEPLDLFVCEMAHFGIEHISPYLDTCKAKRVAFTHVHPTGKYEDIEGLRGKYGFELFTPKDNDDICL